MILMNNDMDLTEPLDIEVSGYYHIEGTFQFTTKEETTQQLSSLVARLMIRKPNTYAVRTTQTRNVDVEYSVDNISNARDSLTNGTATYSTVVNLEKGDRVYIGFDQPDRNNYIPVINRRTLLRPTFKWGDGYDDIPTTEYEIRDFNLAEISLDTVVEGNPDAAMVLYQPNEYSIMTVADSDARMIKMYDDNKEIISINCRTGEINFASELKEPYKMMWLKFQEAFPEAFKSQGNVDVTEVKSEPRRLTTGWILENDESGKPDANNYDRAMEFLK